MKRWINMLLLLIAAFAKGQDNYDKLLKKTEIENFTWKIFELKTANKKLEYENYFVSNFYKTATLKKGKNTEIVAFYSKKKKILRKEKNLYMFILGKKFKTDSIVEFYNDKGLIEYVERWVCVNAMNNSPEDGQVEFKEIYPRVGGAFQRFEYDAKNRVVLFVAPEANGIFLRTRYIYDYNGKLIKRIKTSFESLYQFWE